MQHEFPELREISIVLIEILQDETFCIKLNLPQLGYNQYV
jgi:hypothetical protein